MPQGVDESAWLDSASGAERIEVHVLAAAFFDAIERDARDLAIRFAWKT